MVVDRTAAFFSLVDSLTGDVQVTETASLLPSRDSGVDQEFHKIAKQVSTQIQSLHDTKLEDLRKMVKNMNMYKDNTPQIELLLGSIKTTLESINKNVKELEKIVAGGHHSNQKHAESLLKHVKAQINGVGNALSNSTAAYTKNLSRFNFKVSQYASSSATAEAIFNPNALSDRLDQGDLQELISGPREENAYFKSRMTEVKAMGRQIFELTSMFQQMWRMTAEQTEQIKRIDDDLASVELNVEAGQNELLTYFKRISSDRNMILKIFAILVVFILFFVFFLA